MRVGVCIALCCCHMLDIWREREGSSRTHAHEFQTPFVMALTLLFFFLEGPYVSSVFKSTNSSPLDSFTTIVRCPFIFCVPSTANRVHHHSSVLLTPRGRVVSALFSLRYGCDNTTEKTEKQNKENMQCTDHFFGDRRKERREKEKGKAALFVVWKRMVNTSTRISRHHFFFSRQKTTIAHSPKFLHSYVAKLVDCCQ